MMQKEGVALQINDSCKYTKEYGAGAASVLRLAEKSDITGTHCVVIADSWFGGVRLPPGLRKIGLHNISVIKTGSAGFHALAKTTIDGVELTALAYCGKSHHEKKSKAKKSIFYSYFIATDCVTTLDGKPAEKKCHYSDGSGAPSKFVKINVLVEEYYDAMPAANI
eukprot:124301-Ditylum_brightwellii.AAC.1